MRKTTLIVSIAGILLASCATRPPPSSVNIVEEPNKRFWFRGVRVAPDRDGLLVSGWVVRKKGGFFPIPGHLRIEAVSTGVPLAAAETRWRRINWRSRSVARFKAHLPAAARRADVIRISYHKTDLTDRHW